MNADNIKGCDSPTIVCLCGSGRFKEAFDEAEFNETAAGKIVLTIGCNTKDVARDVDWSHLKPMLDELHLRKIDLCHEVLVLNVGGYIGESTDKEIAYARQIGRRIRYLEDAEQRRLEERGKTFICESCGKVLPVDEEAPFPEDARICEACHKDLMAKDPAYRQSAERGKEEPGNDTR